jgi:alpha-galactosidase
MALNGTTIYCDENGRLQPDPNRFPSSLGDKGFTALAAYAHSKGLLFGIHTMRGISQAAITQKLKVLGTNFTADEVYDPHGACPWAPGSDPQQRFYSLNMSHPGGQAFYNSLYQQYATWGVGMHHTRTHSH